VMAVVAAVAAAVEYPCQEVEERDDDELRDERRLQEGRAEV